MKDKRTGPTKMSEPPDETKSIERAMRRAVEQALLAHKRAGNAVAAWEGERVVLVNADDIRVGGSVKRGRE